MQKYWVLGIATAQMGDSTDIALADLLPLGVLNTSALSTISSYDSISIYLSSIVTNEDKTWYVFNNQQYRRFPSIFGVEFGVGNWPLTGSMSLVGIRNQGVIIAYVRRLDLLL